MARPKPPVFEKTKIVAENRRAKYDYAIDTVYEAGIALTGTEVKSLRAGQGSIAESYAEVKDGQVWLLPHNDAYDPIDGTYATILGKVTAVLRRM